jgi:hypothetical protein
MEFKFQLIRSLDNIRLIFEASELVNTGDYNNVRRTVGMEGDVTFEASMSTDEKERTVKDTFRVMHDDVVSMLAASIGEAVPEGHQLESPARKAERVARLTREREERTRKDREEQEARKIFDSARKELEEVCASCERCKVAKANREGKRYCDNHNEAFDLLYASHNRQRAKPVTSLDEEEGFTGGGGNDDDIPF